MGEIVTSYPWVMNICSCMPVRRIPVEWEKTMGDFRKQLQASVNNASEDVSTWWSSPANHETVLMCHDFFPMTRPDYLICWPPRYLHRWRVRLVAFLRALMTCRGLKFENSLWLAPQVVSFGCKRFIHAGFPISTVEFQFWLVLTSEQSILTYFDQFGECNSGAIWRNRAQIQKVYQI